VFQRSVRGRLSIAGVTHTHAHTRTHAERTHAHARTHTHTRAHAHTERTHAHTHTHAHTQSESASQRFVLWAGYLIEQRAKIEDALRPGQQFSFSVIVSVESDVGVLCVCVAVCVCERERVSECSQTQPTLCMPKIVVVALGAGQQISRPAT
jgi:hypothetical protein